jgi:hypothetical protein
MGVEPLTHRAGRTTTHTIARRGRAFVSHL